MSEADYATAADTMRNCTKSMEQRLLAAVENLLHICGECEDQEDNDPVFDDFRNLVREAKNLPLLASVPEIPDQPPPPRTWLNQFGAEYDVPQEIT